MARGDMVVRIGPSEGAGPIVLEVLCEHGTSTAFWTQACRNGCQADPARAGVCERLNPSQRALRQAAVRHHERHVACRCPELFWSLEGPQHPVRRRTALEDGRIGEGAYDDVREGPAVGAGDLVRLPLGRA